MCERKDMEITIFLPFKYSYFPLQISDRKLWFSISQYISQRKEVKGDEQI